VREVVVRIVKRKTTTKNRITETINERMGGGNRRKEIHVGIFFLGLPIFIHW